MIVLVINPCQISFGLHVCYNVSVSYHVLSITFFFCIQQQQVVTIKKEAEEESSKLPDVEKLNAM